MLRGHCGAALCFCAQARDDADAGAEEQGAADTADTADQHGTADQGGSASQGGAAVKEEPGSVAGLEVRCVCVCVCMCVCVCVCVIKTCGQTREQAYRCALNPA